MKSKISIGHVLVKVRSAKQIEASQINGLKAQGPKTLEGKVRSSVNALKHGGYSQKYVMLGEDPHEFEEYAALMRDHWKPDNFLEEDLVEQFILCAWKHRRLAWMENAVLSTEMLDYYRHDLKLDYRKTRKISKTYLRRGAKVELSKSEELIAIAFKLDVNSHQSLMVLEEIQSRNTSKYFKLLEQLLELKQKRHS